MFFFLKKKKSCNLFSQSDKKGFFVEFIFAIGSYQKNLIFRFWGKVAKTNKKYPRKYLPQELLL